MVEFSLLLKDNKLYKSLMATLLCLSDENDLRDSVIIGNTLKPAININIENPKK